MQVVDSNRRQLVEPLQALRLQAVTTTLVATTTLAVTTMAAVMVEMGTILRFHLALHRPPLLLHL
jgi:hypothetical protein